MKLQIIKDKKENKTVNEVNSRGAYSGFSGRMLYKNIKVIEENILETSSNYYNLVEGIQYEPNENELGGIIVLSEEVNAIELSKNKLINFVKQKIRTITNRVQSTSKIDDIAAKHDLVGWTIGRFLTGRYTAKNGKFFGEKSLSVEIVGVTDDELISIAEDLCKAFDQEAVLVKSYSSHRVMFVDAN